MNFEKSGFTNNHTISSKNAISDTETDRVVAVFYNEDDLIAATGLSKKVELIDGKAYQFEARKKTLQGIYCGGNDTMYIHQGYYFNLENCTNIQLLEVKS